jgi:cyclic-di-AMP phosphodiesterase PgpH
MLKIILSFVERIKYWNLISVLLATVVVVFFLPKEGKFKYEYQKGKLWNYDDLQAPFDFPIYKSYAEIEDEQKEVLKNFYPIYVLDENIRTVVIENFEKKFESDWEKFDYEESFSNTTKEQTKTKAKEYLNDVLRTGLISKEDDSGKKNIYLSKNNQLKIRDSENFYSITEALNNIEKKNKDEDPKIQTLVNNAISSVITHNIIYDEITSNKLKNSRLENISQTRGKISKTTKIIAKKDLIDEEKYNLLSSLEKAYSEKTGGESNYYAIMLGQSILTLLIFSLLLWFIFMFRKDIFNDIFRMSFILITFMLTVLMTLITLKIKFIPIYALPFCVLPIIIRAFFDTRLAIFIHINAILLISFIAPNSYEFIFIQLLAGIYGIFSIYNLSKRSQLFKTVLTIFFIYMLSYFAFMLIREGSFTGFRINYVYWFFISSFITLFSFPLIFISEKIFGFISDVTLIELSDTNSKLLRELANKAPGTFQHSLQVANLCEAAIRAIGGDVLLVRTGALYHDIGKMDTPMYFIENQNSNFNPHDKIECRESAKIIINHVKNGIDLAKSEGLPEKIIDFIRTHHGDGLVKYFYYNELKNKQKENCESDVQMNDFKYPGPKPFSKEMAVLMMSDSVEAASRSLKIHTEEKLSDLVDQIIDNQIADNQFKDADITFKDITIVRDILKKNLMNIYHVRVEYPEKTN